MLTLSRHVGERIRLKYGTLQIWIMVSAADRGKGRISIEAPREVEISREELLPRQVRAVAVRKGGEEQRCPNCQGTGKLAGGGCQGAERIAAPGGADSCEVLYVDLGGEG